MERCVLLEDTLLNRLQSMWPLCYEEKLKGCVQSALFCFKEHASNRLFLMRIVERNIKLIYHLDFIEEVEETNVTQYVIASCHWY
jgi:hypothetical protein